jgi:hypothetical protein
MKRRTPGEPIGGGKSFDATETTVMRNIAITVWKVSGRSSLCRQFRKRRSATRSLRHRETVLQHLKTNDFAIGHGENDGERRLDNSAGSLEPGR